MIPKSVTKRMASYSGSPLPYKQAQIPQVAADELSRAYYLLEHSHDYSKCDKCGEWYYWRNTPDLGQGNDLICLKCRKRKAR